MPSAVVPSRGPAPCQTFAPTGAFGFSSPLGRESFTCRRSVFQVGSGRAPYKVKNRNVRMPPELEGIKEF